MEDDLEGKAAGFASRAVAFVLDLVIIAVTLAMGIWTVTGILRILPHVKVSWVQDNAAVIEVVIGTVYVLLYWVVCWVLFGQTPGKAVLGVKIVPTRGKRVGWGRALLRVIGYILSSLALYVGFLWVLYDDERRAWHDHLAGTRVVYARTRLSQLLRSTQEASPEPADQASL